MSASRDLLARLVAFDTTSRESNLALIDFVARYLDVFGVPYERIYNAAGTKANLFATLGPADVPGIVLSGHTDVVPVDGQAWTRPAFELSEEEGRLYGQPRHRRHEGLSGLSARPGARGQPRAPAAPAASGAVLRRRGGLPGSARPARPVGTAPGQAVAVPHRRTHRSQARAWPQGQGGHALPGARCGLSFGLCAPGCQRHRIRRASGRRTWPAGRGAQGAGTAGRPLRSTLLHGADRADRRRPGTEHRPPGLRLRLRDPRPARRGPPTR
ncbi:hypothetical protein Q3H58_000292 [Pseudomonas psychrotolerans]|nr:hypothetical protein [Pseudomonas psychrotolerans]